MFKTDIITIPVENKFCFQATTGLESLNSMLPEHILKAVIDKLSDSIMEKYGDVIEDMVLRGTSPEAVSTMVLAAVNKAAGEKIAKKIDGVKGGLERGNSLKAFEMGVY